MSLEKVSDKQGISMMVLFFLGTNFILGTAGAAKKDAWLAILIGMAAAQIIFAMYARILALFPDRDVFEINEIVFGKFIGKIINIFYTAFAIYLCAEIFYIVLQFIKEIGLRDTPTLVPLAFIVILCTWSVKEGVEVIGRLSGFFIIAVSTSFIMTTLLSTPKMDPDNIRPILYEGLSPVLKGSITAFFFPFTESVIFLMVFSSLKDNKSPFRIYLRGSIIGGMAMCIVSARNIMVIGVELLSRNYFPSFTVAGRINIGDFLQRIELIVMVVIILAVYIKASCCLLAASNGISKICGFKDYRFITLPVALIIMALSFKLFENLQEVLEWIQKYKPIYSSIFTIIVPVITYLGVEVYYRKKAAKNRN
jgi:spore germination protein KB